MNRPCSFVASLCIGIGLTSVPMLAQTAKSRGLEILLTKDSPRSSVPNFLIRFRNAGDDDLLLNLGTMLANGSKHYPDAVRLLLTDSAGQTLSLELRGPAIIAGRVDPLIVPLPQGAQFAFPLDLRHYIAPNRGVWKLKLKPGIYLLKAEYTGVAVSRAETNLDMGGVALFPIWTGQTSSQVISFEILNGAP